MNHLITGGSGFLGSFFAQKILARGESVVILDTWEDTTRDPRIRFIKGDVTNHEDVRRAVQGIDVVHHNAALVPITKSGRGFWDVNVTGSQIMAEEAVKAGVKAFIYMSSSAVFGVPTYCPVPLDAPTNPFEDYGRSKLEGEKISRKICEQAGVRWIGIRPRTILAPGRIGIFRILFDWIHEGRNVYTIGQGLNQLQFVHAHDLIDACLLLLDKNCSGAYNVGTDRFDTLRAMLENLIKDVRSTSRVVGLPVGLSVFALRALDFLRLSPLGPYHYTTYHKTIHFDIAPLQKLGWKPKYSNDEMMRESYDWFLKNRAALSHDDGQSAHRKQVKEKILWLLRRIS